MDKNDYHGMGKFQTLGINDNQKDRKLDIGQKGECLFLNKEDGG
jgi:hypothetical protein